MPKRLLRLLHSPNWLLTAGIILLIIGLGLGLHDWAANRRAVNQAKKAIALANAGRPSPAPSTVEPTATAKAAYTVPATHPRYLIIPKLGVDARVLSVGVTRGGAIGTPGNVFDTAWFNQTGLPGQAGAMLIDGHVSSWTTHGVFYAIKTLVPGDTMSVQRGDGTTYHYKVIKVQTYAANAVDTQKLLAPIVSGHAGLNLITCTGDVIAGTNTFNERVIVYTEQIAS